MSRGRSVDINVDAGEGCDDATLMPSITSVSVACGGHTGDDESMTRTLALAARHGLRLGAHPSYPDRAGFGRHEVEIDAATLGRSLREQVTTLLRLARRLGFDVTHVKAHGALYNRAWRDPATAATVAAAVHDCDPSLALFCPPASSQLEAAKELGLRAITEVFLDRRYQAEGNLVPRSEPGAVIGDAQDLEAQLQSLGAMDFETMCVHGDNPAAEILLTDIDVRLRRFGLVRAPYDIGSPPL